MRHPSIAIRSIPNYDSRNRMSIAKSANSDNGDKQQSQVSMFNLEKDEKIFNEFKVRQANNKNKSISLLGDFENELNSLRLENKTKLLKINIAKAKIEFQNKLSMFVKSFTNVRLVNNNFSENSENVETKNVLKRKLLKSEFIPPSKELSFEFLFGQMQKIKSIEEDLNDLIGEELSISKNLVGIHIIMKNDIVK